MARAGARAYRVRQEGGESGADAAHPPAHGRAADPAVVPECAVLALGGAAVARGAAHEGGAGAGPAAPDRSCSAGDSGALRPGGACGGRGRSRAPQMGRRRGTAVYEPTDGGAEHVFGENVGCADHSAGVTGCCKGSVLKPCSLLG